MISASSNCCRVDAVKASANTLRQQLAQHVRGGLTDNAARNAEQQLLSVDQQVRANNATQAEVALSAAKFSIEKLNDAPAIAPVNSAYGGADYSSLSRGQVNLYA